MNSNKPEAMYPDIQEILRQRRDTLNRVKADLKRIDRLQQEFQQASRNAVPDSNVVSEKQTPDPTPSPSAGQSGTSSNAER